MSGPDIQQTLDRTNAAIKDALFTAREEQRKTMLIFLEVARMLEILQTTCPNSILSILFTNNGNGSQPLEQTFAVPGHKEGGAVLDSAMIQTAQIGLGSNPLAALITQVILDNQPQIHTAHHGFEGFQVK